MLTEQDWCWQSHKTDADAVYKTGADRVTELQDWCWQSNQIEANWATRLMLTEQTSLMLTEQQAWCWQSNKTNNYSATLAEQCDWRWLRNKTDVNEQHDQQKRSETNTSKRATTLAFHMNYQNQLSVSPTASAAAATRSKLVICVH